MKSFPVYMLRFDRQWKIVFPENKDDLGHCEFWEQTVSFLVAQRYRISQRKLANLPYSQRRARVVEPDRLYYGELQSPELLTAIRKAVGNHRLRFIDDDHEKRLPEDVSQFRQLIR